MGDDLFAFEQDDARRLLSLTRQGPVSGHTFPQPQTRVNHTYLVEPLANIPAPSEGNELVFYGTICNVLARSNDTGKMYRQNSADVQEKGSGTPVNVTIPCFNRSSSAIFVTEGVGSGPLSMDNIYTAWQDSFGTFWITWIPSGDYWRTGYGTDDRGTEYDEGEDGYENPADSLAGGYICKVTESNGIPARSGTTLGSGQVEIYSNVAGTLTATGRSLLVYNMTSEEVSFDNYVQVKREAAGGTWVLDVEDCSC